MLQKIVKENKFPKLIAEGAKLKNNKFVLGIILIKSERIGASIDDIYVLHLFWFIEALSFPRGVFISRPSMSRSVNRHRSLYFQ